MKNDKRFVARILMLLAILTGWALSDFASTPKDLQPAATLDLSSAQLSARGLTGWTTVSFTSDTAIAVSVCRGGCSLSLVKWDGETLKLSAHSVTNAGAVAIYPADQGLIFSLGIRGPMMVYSADLSTSHALPSSISLVSASGKTVAEASGDSWKVYRFTGTLQAVTEGAGHLQSISDDTRVVQVGNVMSVETLEGVRLGSFSVSSDKGCTSFAELIAGNRLYLNDCKGDRIVDFNGETLSQLSPPKGCCFFDDMWSADGKRLLFDYRDRKVFQLRNAGEILRMFATLGMSGEEWDNREAVSVVDTLTGKSCLEWRRTFAKANDVESGRTAAISPSGEFVAIAARSTLSLYRLPTHCDDSSTIPTNK